MAATPEKLARRSLRSSYITTIISITLVLFMLGLVGLLLLKSQQIAKHVKENLGFTVFMTKDVNEAEIKKLQKSLDAAPFVLRTEHVSAEQAKQMLEEELGADFKLLDENPLHESIEVRLNAEYANPDSVKWIVADIKENSTVMEVNYQPDLVSIMNERIGTITIYMLAFAGVLFLIALVLINNSIRLTIYSKRFLIRTMQLVGATGGFIRRPFVWRGIRHGVYAAIVAIGMLAGALYYFNQEIPELFELKDRELIATLFGIVLVLGIFISWISTFFAVRKYLRIRADRLY